MPDAYDSRYQEAVVIARAQDTIAEMRNVEAATRTEDSYTMRIPGGMLTTWRETLESLLFFTRSTSE